MSREIKFRAWDKERGIMKVPYFHEFEDINIQFEDDELVFMQYTGLKDKNGVESYIYDIAKDEFGNIFEITDDYMLLAHLQTIKFEIVGNIYKDSHLLLEA